MLQKILEYKVLNLMMEKVNTEDIICKEQIGFMRGLGTEVNILKLRIKAKELKDERKKGKRTFIFFIDLKKAFDSVNHEILMEKLKKKGFSDEIINTIKKIYSSARLQIDPLNDKVNVNTGVLQGSLISPILFNIYIDDMVRELKENAHDALAYADDMSAICIEMEELNTSIDILERWCENNHIGVNKNKSGIMIIQGYTELNQYRGYPIVGTYKYLGVQINNELDCPLQQAMAKKRLNVYVERNKKLLSEYFSPRSLLKIFNYFQKSRICYGLSSFMDVVKNVYNADVVLMKMLKSVLGLGDSCSNSRLRATIGVSDLEHKMVFSLIKNIKKVEAHFGIKTQIFAEVIKRLTGIVNIYNEKHTLNTIKDMEIGIRFESVRKMAQSDGITISREFCEIIYKEWFRFYDRRDGLVIKFFCNRGFWKLGDSCKHCGGINDRKHSVDFCAYYDNLRLKTLDKLKNTRILYKNRYSEMSLSEILDEMYFSPDKEKRVRTKAMEFIKNFIADFYMTQKR